MQSVDIYYDDTNVYYGKTIPKDVSCLNKVSVSTFDGFPEDYFVVGGELKKQVHVPLLENMLSLEIDNVAKSRGYDSFVSFSVRASYNGPYKEEAVKFLSWSDSCWVYLYSRKFMSVAEFLAGLPKISFE